MVLITDVTTVRRRQRRRQQRKPTTTKVVEYRTTNQVQQTLAGATRRSGPRRQIVKRNSRPNPMRGLDMRYLRCRLDPFSSPGANGIPDGSSTKKIMVDHRWYTDITHDGARTWGFVLQTFPWLPMPVGVQPLGSEPIIVNGLPITAPLPRDLRASWVPISLPPGWQAANQYSWNTTSADPYEASKGRLVAMGVKLIYTGPANTCSGVITCNPSDVGFGDRVLNAAYREQQAGDLTLVDTVAADSAGISVDLNTNPTTINPGSCEFRPEQGATFIAAHKTNDYEFKPVYDIPLIPYCSQAGTPATLLASDGTTGLPPRTYQGGVSWFDDDWTAAQFVASGLNGDASYRVEIVMCMEYLPVVGSSYAQMAKEPPTANLRTIRAAESVQQQSVVAYSNNSPSLFKRALTGLGAMAPFAGMATGNPVAGATAGVMFEGLAGLL